MAGILAKQARPTPGVREQWAVRAVFFIGGFGSASWAPLVPYLKARLAIGEDVLGMLLLCVGIGSLVTMPLSGAAAERFGCRRVLAVACIAFSLILLSLSVVDALPVAAGLLLVFGAFMGCIDTTINIDAVMVEQAAGAADRSSPSRAASSRSSASSRPSRSSSRARSWTGAACS